MIYWLLKVYSFLCKRKYISHLCAWMHVEYHHTSRLPMLCVFHKYTTNDLLHVEFTFLNDRGHNYRYS
jgi:hypothetical protein